VHKEDLAPRTLENNQNYPTRPGADTSNTRGSLREQTNRPRPPGSVSELPAGDPSVTLIEDDTPPKKINLVVDKEKQREEEEARQLRQRRKAFEHPLVRNADEWQSVNALLDSLDQSVQSRVFNRARSAIRSVVSQAQSTERILPGIRESRVKHLYDMHMKYSMALVCIIFIFIGAPMGAIVRKGGFGYPILVSIIFFVIFIILTIFCRKLAESFVVNGAFAGWLPCIILFPVSLYITSRARKDAKLISTDGIGRLWEKVKGIRRKMGKAEELT
ncbi:MAG: LptF/LptG family permease, partial [Bacteroidota bacterium]